jgi:hypothetical protein
MSRFKIYEDSKNYTAQVILLPSKLPVIGLDNLVQINYQGNSCLIGKDSPESELYLFFPSGCKLSEDFLKFNNLYRHNNLNTNTAEKGFFEDNGRVKAIKFRGVISTGFIIPLSSLVLLVDIQGITVGHEFNEVDGVKICEKYIKPKERNSGMSNPKTKIIDEIVDSRFAPEHMDTGHLMKNIHKLTLDTKIIITAKLHGTSARFYNTLVKRKLSIIEKLCRFFGGQVIEETYDYVSASRRVIKSVGFEVLPNKNHYFTTGDLWSEVGKEFFEGRLNEGEAVYCEIVGKTYKGEAIQSGYTYSLEKPKVYIYRITNINSQGIEIDLSWDAVKERALDFGIDVCPEMYQGTVGKLLDIYNRYPKDCPFDQIVEIGLSDVFYDSLLEKPSMIDTNVIEEGFCIRVDKYPKPEIYKIKAKSFILHESGQLDKEVVDIEEEQNVEN